MKRELTRRDFLEVAATAVAAGIAATMAGCQDTIRGGFGNMLTPLASGAPARLKIAPRAMLTATPTAFPAITTDGGQVVFAFTEGDQVVVLSSLCPHRGCTVAWAPGATRFECPCHSGYFDMKGLVTGGPPLGPLKPYIAQLEGGDVYIQG